MEREIAQYLELLERRLFTLYLLAVALQESCEACTKLDLNEINRHAAYQENLCTEIRFLDREVGALQQKLAGASTWDKTAPDLSALAGKLDPVSEQRLRRLLDDLSAAQKKLQRLNRVHAALLQRSRRSVNVLMNFMANYSATYQPPKSTEVLGSPALIRA